MKQKVKDRLKDEQALQSELTKVLSSDLPNFLKSTHTKKQELSINIKFTIFAGVFLVATIFFLYFSGANQESLTGKVTLALALLWTTVLLLSGKSWLINSKLLAREMNMALVPIMTNTLDKMIMYTYNDSKEKEVRELVEKSGLIESPIKKVKSNDRYYIYEENESVFHEIKVTAEKASDSFSGVFAAVPLKGVCDKSLTKEESVKYVVLDEMLYILLEGLSISVHVNTASTKPETVKRHAMNALTPIWRSLFLADELRG